MEAVRGWVWIFSGIAHSVLSSAYIHAQEDNTTSKTAATKIKRNCAT